MRALTPLFGLLSLVLLTGSTCEPTDPPAESGVNCEFFCVGLDCPPESAQCDEYDECSCQGCERFYAEVSEWPTCS